MMRGWLSGAIEYIRFVAEAPDGGVDLFVRDSEADQPSRFRIAETLDALCDALDCARVAAPATGARPVPIPTPQSFRASPAGDPETTPQRDAP